MAANQTALGLLAADADRDTIAAQRRELQLLVEELKDRDRELNEMTATHRQQLAAWEDDRRRLVGLDNRNARLEYELHRRGEQLRSLLKKLKNAESEARTRRCAQEAMQAQLTKMAEEQSRSSIHIQDFEEKNQSLSQSLKSLSMSLDESKSREQELLSIIQIKEKDLSDSSRLVVELSAKLRGADQASKQAEKSSLEARRLADEWKDKYFEVKDELDRANAELGRVRASLEEKTTECDRIKREATSLRSDLAHAVEREKRKDQLADLQKSKQERTDAELSSLRQIYERTRRDLEALYHNIESSRHGMFDVHASNQENGEEDHEDDVDNESLSLADLVSSSSPILMHRLVRSSPPKVASTATGSLSPTTSRSGGGRSRRSGDGGARSQPDRRGQRDDGGNAGGDDKLATSLEKLTSSLDVLAELHESSLHSMNGGSHGAASGGGGSSTSYKRDAIAASVNLVHLPTDFKPNHVSSAESQQP